MSLQQNDLTIVPINFKSSINSKLLTQQVHHVSLQFQKKGEMMLNAHCASSSIDVSNRTVEYYLHAVRMFMTITHYRRPGGFCTNSGMR